MAKHLKNKYENDFAEIHQMIAAAKSKVWQQVNSALISLYWEIGAYVSRKTEEGSWGRGIVEELAQYISSKSASFQGFSARNIWRMKKFYNTYSPYPKLSTLLTEIGWSNHLHSNMSRRT
jgi:DUF1016 N-terminal domain